MSEAHEPGRMRRWAKRIHKTVHTTLNMPVKYTTYVTGRSAGPIFPDRVYIESTNHCNLKCIMCPTGLGVIQRPKGYMTMDLYRHVADELGPLARRARVATGGGPPVGPGVPHSGGEPLMHPRLFDMIRYGKRADIRMETSTN